MSGDTGSPGSEPGPSSPGIVPRVLRQDHENYAVSFFFDNYLLPRDPAVQNGFLECVYPVWTQAAPTSPLRPAVLAVALCLLEAWSFVNPNSPESLARPYYLQGLAAVRQRLEDSGEISDDLIMAPLMLEMYDAVTAFCGSRVHVAPHITGTRALIKGRRKPLFDNETSQRILLGLRGYIVGRAIRSKETVADDVSTWGTITQSVPKTEAFQLEELDIEVANLQASMPNPLTVSGTSSLLVSGALANAQNLDQRLTGWANAIPEDWNPTMVSGPECIPETIRSAGLYQPYCHVYRSIQVANTLNGYRCSRLKIQLMILDCLNHLDPHHHHHYPPSSSSSETIRSNASQIIQEMADAICASVPFFLGDRVHAHRMDDRTVQYPHLQGQDVPREHYSAAGAYAGIFLTQRLGQLLQPGLPLREGQWQWALGQMLRVKRVYRVEAESTS